MCFIIDDEVLFGLLQPIYLNLKIRHRAGNDDPTDDVDHALDFESALTLDATPANRAPVKQVISINGEQVEAASLEHINIHDFTIFEKEEILGNNFMDTIGRRRLAGGGTGATPGGGGIQKTGRSFRNVARTVLHTENFLEALKKHYSHRSDSEPDSEEDDKQTGIAPATFVSLDGAVIATQADDAPGNEAAVAEARSDENEDDSLNTNMNNSSSTSPPPDVFIEDAGLVFCNALTSKDAQEEANPQGGSKGDFDGSPTTGSGGSCHLAKGSSAPTDKTLPLPSSPAAVGSSSRRDRECGCCTVQ